MFIIVTVYNKNYPRGHIIQISPYGPHGLYYYPQNLIDPNFAFTWARFKALIENMEESLARHACHVSSAFSLY